MVMVVAKARRHRARVALECDHLDEHVLRPLHLLSGARQLDLPISIVEWLPRHDGLHPRQPPQLS
eukprot:scaffold79815_cov23-Tisochrysis_lutea.AAC.2